MKKNATTTMFFLYVITIMMIFTVCSIDVQTTLYGVTQEEEISEKSVRSVLSGSYQESYDDWYLDNFPLRSYIVKAYNQFKYTIFNKSANETLVLLKDGSIAEIEYINSYLNINMDHTSYTDKCTMTEEYVKDLKTIQNGLEKQGKAFSYFITPSKADIYPELIPDQFILNSKREIYDTEHQILVKMLEKYEVNYFDAYDTIMEIKENSEIKPFRTTGTHWTILDATVATGEFFQYLNNLYNLDIPLPIVESIEYVDYPTDIVDIDIFRNLNIYFGKMDDYYSTIEVAYDIEDAYTPLSILSFGTSFEGEMCVVINYEGLFEKHSDVRYLQHITIYDAVLNAEYYKLNNDINNLDMKRLIKDHDLFYFESTCLGLTQGHIDFANAMAGESEKN